MSGATQSKAPGVILGRYCLESRVAEGGAAELWLAKDQNGRRVAVKIALQEGDAYLEHEIEALQRLGRHPNLVAPLSADPGATLPHVAYDLGDIRTLREECAGGPSVRPERARGIIGGVLSALTHAHARGLVHGDIRPETVLVGDEGTPLLGDFGLVNASGTLLSLGGTVRAASSCSAVTPGDDRRAVGRLFFELVTQSPPTTAGQIPSEIVASLPSWVDGLYMELVAEDRSPEGTSGAVVQEVAREPDRLLEKVDHEPAVLSARLPALVPTVVTVSCILASGGLLFAGVSLLRSPQSVEVTVSRVADASTVEGLEAPQAPASAGPSVNKVVLSSPEVPSESEQASETPSQHAPPPLPRRSERWWESLEAGMYAGFRLEKGERSWSSVICVEELDGPMVALSTTLRLSETVATPTTDIVDASDPDSFSHPLDPSLEAVALGVEPIVAAGRSWECQVFELESEGHVLRVWWSSELAPAFHGGCVRWEKRAPETGQLLESSRLVEVGPQQSSQTPVSPRPSAPTAAPRLEARQVPCEHPVHESDRLHEFDTVSIGGKAHPYDTEHTYDALHEFHLQHPEGHPRHSYDTVTQTAPAHQYDLMHTYDNLHAYDTAIVQYVTSAFGGRRPIYGQVPCQHRVACTHSLACTHTQQVSTRVSCSHIRACKHKTSCTHQIACRHRTICRHRVSNSRQVPCTHEVPCSHRQHEWDLDTPVVSAGSGFFVAKGYVLTNAHVVDSQTQVSVELSTGWQQGTVIARDPRLDLALVRLEVEGEPLRFASHGAQQGALAFAIGYGRLLQDGRDLLVTRGAVSAFRNGEVVFDGTVNPGNSGGPLVDAGGRWLGVVVAKTANERFQTSFGLAIDGKVARQWVESILGPVVPQAAGDSRRDRPPEQVLKSVVRIVAGG